MKQQLILNILDPSPQTLDNFVWGKNAEILTVLQDQPLTGRAIYFWGPPGVGRTHLLKAVSHGPEKIYFDAHTIHPPQLASLATADHSEYTAIAIDNIEHLDQAGQAALFSLYNRWRQEASGAQAFALYLSGSHAPRAMPIREDLRTRLGWDLSFRLEHLSDPEKAQALQQWASNKSIHLASSIVNWLLVHHSRDMRQLRSLIDALDYYSLQEKRPITLPLLKEWLTKHSLS